MDIYIPSRTLRRGPSVETDDFTSMINLNLSEMDIYIDPSEETNDSSTDDFEFGFDSD